MIIHIMSDGSRRDSIEGVVVPLKSHQTLYHIIENISEEVSRNVIRKDTGKRHGNSD